MRRNSKNSKHFFWWVLFICYLVGISYFLFFSERYGRTEGSGGYRYNLTLFQEINRFIKYHRSIGFEGMFVNLVGNVVAFMPFGFFLPMVSQRDARFHRVLFWTFGFSLAIESIQLIFQIGIFDVDDLMMNTLGGVLGFWCFCLVRFHNRKR